jgi:hypothetical protein
MVRIRDDEIVTWELPNLSREEEEAAMRASSSAASGTFAEPLQNE